LRFVTEPKSLIQTLPVHKSAVLGYDTPKESEQLPTVLAIFAMKNKNLWYGLVVLVLRVALVTVLVTAGWFVYKELPGSSSASDAGEPHQATVQIVLRRDQKAPAATDGLPVEIYPIDIVAVRHEFFTERRAGERFDDFFKQRMKGRAPISARFDMQGQTTVEVTPGNWWIHATLPGEEELEWRLPITVAGRKQLVELTPQNAYLRSKSF
jgi:hypothetical protein